MDLVGALLGLVLCLPVLLVAALLVWWEDGWPVLFVQPRVGREGRLFPCFKLRTMRRGASDQPGPVPAPPSDPRHLRCGRPLRRWAVDEIPQLLNVLRGEMSLVGPRPAQPFEVALQSARDRGRLAVPPGLTGLAQVCGRNRLTWAERIELDLEYVRRRSLALDLWILWRTLPQLVDAEAAFGAEVEVGTEAARETPAGPAGHW